MKVTCKYSNTYTKVAKFQTKETLTGTHIYGNNWTETGTNVQHNFYSYRIKPVLDCGSLDATEDSWSVADFSRRRRTLLVSGLGNTIR